jgi:hypothetical protein
MPLDRQAVDGDGITLAHDHPGLLGTDLVFRLIPKQWRVPGSSPGIWRLSTQAFENSSDRYGGCSVLLANLLAEAQVSIDDIVAERGALGAIKLAVSEIRVRSLQVGFDPLPDDPFHGQIWGKITKGVSKGLLGVSSWAVEVPDTLIRE